MQHYDAWKEAYTLGEGPSRIAKLELPSLPPLSPPAGSTVFPDEAVPTLAVPSSIQDTNSKSPQRHPLSPTSLPPQSPRSTQPTSPKRRRSKSPSPSSPSHAQLLPPTPPLQTVSMDDVQPHRRTYSPPPKLSIPDWIPIDNYHPAHTPPHTPPTVSMPLTTQYSSELPQLPPSPHPSKKHKKSNESMYALSVQYSINGLSDALHRSSKCVLTADWKIAQAELRHVRAMERIEAKKENGRWSLRQPKKLRGPVIPKAHWDYLLDEMVSQCNDQYQRGF